MTTIRLVLTATVLTLTLAACGKDQEETAAAGQENALLAFVPSDTPYVVADLEPVPDAVLDAYLSRMQPVLDELQLQLVETRDRLQSGETAGANDDDPAARVALALMNELDGKLNRAGLESLGIDLGSNKVFYGMGAFPVARIGLSDPAMLRATIQRVLDNAGITAPEKQYQGVSYWSVSKEDLDGASVSIYAAILDDHLAFAILPTTAEAELLPAFLGITRPGHSDIAARLAELNREHGYTPYGSGILDLHRLADQFLDPKSTLAQAVAKSGHNELETLTPQCVEEIHGIIDNAPRLTVGTKELDANKVAIQYRVETLSSLASELQALVSRVPAVDPDSNQAVELSLGVKLGAVRDFLRQKTAAIVAEPYQCEALQHLNDWAMQASERLDQPVPPFVNNFLGVRASLDSLDFDFSSIPAQVRGLLALHVDKPEMFVGMAQMFLPDLSGLNLARGEPPVRIPESVVSIQGIVAYAAMSSDAIGLSVGEGEQDRLEAFLDRKPGPEGVFLSATYDAAAYAAYSRKMTVQAMGDDSDGDAVRKLAETTQDAVAAMADRNKLTMSFAPDGFVADTEMTFK